MWTWLTPKIRLPRALITLPRLNRASMDIRLEKMSFMSRISRLLKVIGTDTDRSDT